MFDPITALPDHEDAIIRVSNLGKAYRLYDRPEDRLLHSLMWRFGRTYGRDFWALRDVSFDIGRGESVGIIGRNGSGKSTLMQILAGTLAATTGQCQTNGRVSALLELGSGFNSEYTGSENVFLNGAILGMSRAEMEERFDAIARFAEIGQFINQPIKFYSSGMVLRLAFAVQVMVRKDVLIVDEALAVGDEAFQRKCMRQLEEFREEGGTVLLVSHSVDAIVRQCTRCLFMNDGHLVLDGPSKPVTDIYQRYLYGTTAEREQTLSTLRTYQGSDMERLLALLSPGSSLADTAPAADRVELPTGVDADLEKTTELEYGNGSAEISGCVMLDIAGHEVNVLVAGETYVWQFQVYFRDRVSRANFGMSLRTVDGLVVAGINTEWMHKTFPDFETGQQVVVRFKLKLNLAAGVYFTEAGVVGETERPIGPGGFLHRRVDIGAVRVVSPANQRIVGITYLYPEVSVDLAKTPVPDGTQSSHAH